MYKAYTKEEDEILINYSLSTAIDKLSNRTKLSIKKRRIRLQEQGVKLETSESSISKLNAYIIPGLDKSKLTKNSSILEVLRLLDIKLDDLKKKGRSNESIIFKKKIFCYFLKENLNIKLETIAKYIDRDHSLVSFHYKDIKNKISIKDKEVIKIISELNKILHV